MTCTAAGNSRVEACDLGFYKTDRTGLGSSDVCTACTAQSIGCATHSSVCIDQTDVLACSVAASGFYLEPPTCVDPGTVCDSGNTGSCPPGCEDSGSACTGTAACAFDGTEATCTLRGCTYNPVALMPTACDAVPGAASVTCTEAGNSDAVCQTGFFHRAVSGGMDTCTACDPVQNAISVTCSAPGSSDAVCRDGFFRTEVADGMDSCTACDPVQHAISVTCAAVSASRAVCGDRYYVVAGATDSSDACAACDEPEHAASWMCSEAGNSRATCNVGFFHTDGGTSSDTCTECGIQPGCTIHAVQCLNAAPQTKGCSSVATGYYLQDGEARVCTDVPGAASVTCTEAGNSDAVCQTGFFHTSVADGMDTCTACTPVENSIAGSVTCNSPADSRVTECSAGFFKSAGVDAGGGSDATPDTCTACTAVDNAVSVTCTDATDSVPICMEGFSDTENPGACTECTAQTGCAVHATHCLDSRAEQLCTTAEDGYYLAAGQAMPCTPVQNAAAVNCIMAENTRADCSPGYYHIDRSGFSVSDECSPCEDVENAASVTCSEPGNSRAVCALGFYHVDNTGTSESDACTECTPQSAGCAAHTLPCLSGEAADTRQCTFAAPGYFLTENVATACEPVANAVAVTCTEAGNSDAVCQTGFFHTSVADGMDTCTAC
eukprot:COSAG02_NODE_7548_length_2966_cov_5.574119_3_plen_663_part_01